MTLVIPLIFKRLIEALNILGGTDGMGGLTPFPNMWVGLYSGIGMVIVALFALRRLVNSDFGVVLSGIRDNDLAVMGSGIDIHWYKIKALFIAALPATFAGAFLAHQFMFVGMSYFFLDFSIMPIAITIVGGPGSLAGAVLGASILVPMSEIFRAFGPLRIVAYALLLIVFITLKSEGLFNFFKRKYHQFEKVVKV
jgi:branched-chain amino acid transport system permease protein